MKKISRKLSLKADTIRMLTKAELTDAAGGLPTIICTNPPVCGPVTTYCPTQGWTVCKCITQPGISCPC